MLDSYSGATRVIFIVGSPIAQVKSPEGVTRSLRAAGRDVVVVPAHVEPADLADFFSIATRMPNVEGLIVTVPHKFAACALCTSLSARARSIGAVNIARRCADGGWHGDMNDGEGHVQGLRKLGCDPRGMRALLVGAGGAGSAIAHALIDAGVASLAICDADAQRRDALNAKLRGYGIVSPSVGSSDPTEFDLVINATPMGMRASDPIPIDVDGLTASMFVSDVVTAPTVPPLIQSARARGCKTMTGTGMFESVRESIIEFYSPTRN